MSQVSGRVALVTGGASGIGKATALNAAGAEAVAAEIVAAGGKAQGMAQDTIDETVWQSVIAATQKAFGKLDVLVNNAGIAIAGPIETFSLADWRKQSAVNIEGVFLGVKHAIPAMRAAGGGSIINLSSIAGLRGNRTGLAAYSATKGAVRLFTKSAALEGAKDKIRVNSVHPGIIETPIWDAILPPGEARRNASDLNQRATVIVPTGVLGQPQDIANGILFLASDQSSYMTGSELVIDAGVGSRSVATMKSSIRIASSGLCEPWALRMKIIAVGTPAAAKAAESWAAPLAISMAPSPFSRTPCHRLLRTIVSMRPGAALVTGPSSKRTPRRASMLRATSSIRPSICTKKSGLRLRRSSENCTSPLITVMAWRTGSVKNLPTV